MHIKYAAQSKVGVKRGNNEDSYKVEVTSAKDSPSGHVSMLFAVADGMGGHPCGEVASILACEALTDFIESVKEQSVRELQNVLVKRFHSIDAQLRLYTKKKPGCLHMGTTLSVFIILDEQAIIAHVGDTRIYCLRDGKLKLMTTDHTFVQDMVNRGLLATDKLASAPYRNVLTKVMGTDEPLENVFTQTFDIAAGDRFLLSTDGFHDLVSFQDIESMMRGGINSEETSLQLLTKALDEGAQDDVTVMVVFTA